MGNDLKYLRAQMIYSAYKANCLHDLEREAVLCEQVVRVEIYIGAHLLTDFPVSDVLDSKAWAELTTELQKLYINKFEYYRDEIRKAQAEQVNNSDGTMT